MAIERKEERTSVETLARTFRYLFGRYLFSSLWNICSPFSLTEFLNILCEMISTSPFVYVNMAAAQLLSRGITFLFNTWIVRHLNEDDLALYAIKFHVFLTVIMLSREGIRRACMRIDIKPSDGGQFEASIAKLLRIAWCTPVIGLLFVLATCTFLFRSQSLSLSDPFGWAIIIFGFGCMLELLAEPLYIFSQNLLLLKLRLRVETIATFLRCLTTYILISKKASMEKAIVFALSQAAYGACLFLGYWIYYLFFHAGGNSQLFPFRTWRFHVLGSLVVRMVFLPFEESAYATFAKFASGQSPQRIVRLGNALVEALKLVMLIGLIVIAFGPSYSYALTRILYERKWSDGEASTALRYYCLYVIFVAMNGTSEAFVHAVADKRELKQSNNSLVMFSVIYMLLNVALVQYAGAIGLITANSINMILRIIYSAIFIRHYFQVGLLLFCFSPLHAIGLANVVPIKYHNTVV
ncbi:hypothetical protein Taro_044442 [Colocasia esculenta]|uniref:Protein RFT1 homolog n=1 Tax=Colocasia esculenta TaxID=4460 RepID=A0A843X5H2_COLES|nr:hypothetical protein [Colocasia esculenta]